MEKGRAVFSDKKNTSNAIISYVDNKNKKTTRNIHSIQMDLKMDQMVLQIAMEE